MLACALFLFGTDSKTFGDEAKLRFAAAETADARAAAAILTEAYGRLGIEIEVEYLNGKLALARADSGLYDGDVQRIDGIARRFPNLIQVQIPVNYLEGVAFTNRSDTDVSGWHSLRVYRVGIVKGILFAEEGTQGMEVSRVASNEQLVELLAENRIDLAVMPRISGLVAAQVPKEVSENRSDIQASGAVLETLFLYNYLNARHENLVPQVERVLKQMLLEGTTKRIRHEVYSGLLNLDVAGLPSRATGRGRASPSDSTSESGLDPQTRTLKRLVISTPGITVTSVAANDVLREAYGQLGYELEMRHLSSVSHANAGLVDGELMRIGGLSRRFKNLVQIPIPVNYTQLIGFATRLDVHLRGWSSLRPYRLGLIDGILLTEQETRGMDRRFATTPDQLVQWLSDDEIDIAVLPRDTGSMSAIEQAASDIRELPGVLETVFVYHYLNTKNKHLVPDLTRKLKVMLLSGETLRHRTQSYTRLLNARS